MHFLGVDVGPGVLLAIDDAGLQCLVHFAERHHLRDRAERAELRFQHLRRLDSEFQSLVVGGREQLLVGAHLLETVVPVSKPGHALRIQKLQQPGAERTVGDLTQRLQVGEDIGQIEHLEFPDADRAELGVRRRQHLHRAELQRLQLFLVLVELRVGIDFDLDLAVGVFLGQFLELFCRKAFWRVGRNHVAELDDDRIVRQCGPGQSERCDRRRVKPRCGVDGPRPEGGCERRRVIEEPQLDPLNGRLDDPRSWGRLRRREGIG